MAAYWEISAHSANNMFLVRVSNCQIKSNQIKSNISVPISQLSFFPPVIIAYLCILAAGLSKKGCMCASSKFWILIIKVSNMISLIDLYSRSRDLIRACGFPYIFYHRGHNSSLEHSGTMADANKKQVIS